MNDQTGQLCSKSSLLMNDQTGQKRTRSSSLMNNQTVQQVSNPHHWWMAKLGGKLSNPHYWWMIKLDRNVSDPHHWWMAKLGGKVSNPHYWWMIKLGIKESMRPIMLSYKRCIFIKCQFHSGQIYVLDTHERSNITIYAVPLLHPTKSNPVISQATMIWRKLIYQPVK